MPTIHDAPFRAALQARLQALRPDSPRQWGKMSPDQMLWHVNGALSIALGEVKPPARRPPLPRPVMKFVVLKLPWVKGAPTMPTLVANGSFDFETERARCAGLIEALGAKPANAPSTWHPLFGPMTVLDSSGLQAKHLDHHFKQFGA